MVDARFLMRWRGSQSHERSLLCASIPLRGEAGSRLDANSDREEEVKFEEGVFRISFVGSGSSHREDGMDRVERPKVEAGVANQ